MVARAELNQVAIQFNLGKDIMRTHVDDEEVSVREHIYPECRILLLLEHSSILMSCLYDSDPASILRTPCNRNYRLDISIRRKIAAHLVTQYGCDFKEMVDLIPMTMESWAKVRIQGGDWIRTRTTPTNLDGRDQSFVRVSADIWFIDQTK